MCIRDSYYDAQDPDGLLTFIDALYYSTVTITTTGYGDIVPATQWSRFVTTVVVTPPRVIFLILLVGTTLEVLANQSRFLFRLRNWQKEMKDHIIICGYGIKGEAALEYLKNHEDGQPAVAVDSSNDSLERANGDGISGILGSAYDTEILKAAEIHEAKTVIVALPTDEASILTVLRARELNPKVNIVAPCSEQENVELLQSSGADPVIVSSHSAARIPGLAAEILRTGEQYLLCPHCDATVNDKPVREKVLAPGDRVRLGASPAFTFYLPCPLSTTALLRLEPPTLLQGKASEVLLLDQFVIIGRKGLAHIKTPLGPMELVLVLAGGRLTAKCKEMISVDGAPEPARECAIELGRRVCVAGLSFTVTEG